jgi:penicillin V acylase-like amidase (Ntn superfamily)
MATNNRWEYGGRRQVSFIPTNTVWSSVADLKNLTWSFGTYKDQSIRVVDVKQALAAADGKVRHISMESQQLIETFQPNSSEMNVAMSGG